MTFVSPVELSVIFVFKHCHTLVANHRSSFARRTTNTMILLQFSSILRSFLLEYNFFFQFLRCFTSKPGYFIELFLLLLLQDDAIRNLFSAKTMREFSAQSLLTFLVYNSSSWFVLKVHILINLVTCP